MNGLSKRESLGKNIAQSTLLILNSSGAAAKQSSPKHRADGRWSFIDAPSRKQQATSCCESPKGCHASGSKQQGASENSSVWRQTDCSFICQIETNITLDVRQGEILHAS